MQRISFSPNQEIRLLGKTCRVESVNDQNVVVVWESGARSTYTLQTLLTHSYSGNLKSAPKKAFSGSRPQPQRSRRVGALLMDLSAKQQEAARKRWQLLRAIGDDVPIKRGDKSMEAFVADSCAAMGISPAPSLPSLINWRRALRLGGGDPQSLAPHFHRRGGKGRLRFEAEVCQEMNAVIDNLYLVTSGNSARKAHEALVARLSQANHWRGSQEQLKIPSYSTFKRHIDRYDAYDITAAREGERAAQRKFRHVEMNTELYGFNECWEIDHCRMDILVVDPDSKQVIARPWLTTMIEHRTRAIMGIHIGLGGASTQSVLSCLMHAIKPKTYLKEEYPEIQGEWPCCGMPVVIKYDNGAEFHSHTLKAVGAELLIEFLYCPTKKPWFKARIERFFGTLSRGLLHSLPGTTGNSIRNRKDVGDANLPVIDLKLLKKMLHIWIVDDYMQSECRGIK